MVLRRGETIREASEDEENDDTVVLKDYINEAGFYSVPKEKWQILNESDRSYVKSFNEKLRKDYQKNNKKDGNNKRHQRQVNTRRTTTNEEEIAEDDVNPSSTKRRRTVQFQDNDNNDEKVKQLHNESTEEKTISNKRSILKFRLKDDKE